jgi:tetratricopeptide (TPR) repeat protein
VPLLEQVLEKRRAICGPTHPDTLGAMHSLAMNYTYVDRFAESLALHEKVLQLLKSTNGPEQDAPSFLMCTFAVACQEARAFDQADRLLREVLQQHRKRVDFQGRIWTASTLGWLARNWLLQQQYETAEPLLREALAIFEKERPDDPKRFYWVSHLGGVLLGQEKYAEAEPLLLQGYEGMKQREAILQTNWRRRLAEAGERVVRFYEVTRQPEKASAWRRKLSKASDPSR